jgi:signal transduction histidine kinase
MARGPSLLADAFAAAAASERARIAWWWVDHAPRDAQRDAGEIDAAALELAAEARARDNRCLGRAAWQAICSRRVRPGSGGGWLPPIASPAVLAGVLLCALCLHGLRAWSCAAAWCSAEQLAGAVHAIGAGELGARAPVGGTREIAEVAEAFNAMSEALSRRSEALEKAVSDLRASNQRLREARAGLDRAERLAAVGRLAAGVAHEVGNPMGALLAFMDLASRDPGLGAAGREHLARGRRGKAGAAANPAPAARFSNPPRAALSIELARLCGDGGAGPRAAALRG